MLADIAADLVPDVAALACDLFLGPLGPPRPGRAVLRALAAAAALAPVMRDGAVPALRRCRERPRPGRDERRTLRACLQAPPRLWARQGEGWVPLLPPGDPRPAAHPVRGRPAPLPGADAPRYAVGRVVPVAGRTPRFVAAIGLATAPPPTALWQALLDAPGDLRLLDPGRPIPDPDTREALLRARSAALYRLAVEAAEVLEPGPDAG